MARIKVVGYIPADAPLEFSIGGEEVDLLDPDDSTGLTAAGHMHLSLELNGLGIEDVEFERET